MTLPQFEGARLTQAREIRQMTATFLAERVGASPGAVSQWEDGSQPRAGARTAIAKTLELPEPFFLRPMLPTIPTVVRFRSMSAATKRARVAAHGRIQWLHEIVTVMQDEVAMPAVDLPQLDMPDPERITSDDIERAAEATRQHWGLRDGPIPDLGKLLESKGIVVARLSLNAAQLDGLSAWSGDGRPYIVLNSEKASCVRSRFDAGHELFHLIAHRRAHPRPDTALHKLMEKQAHYFAAAFIFPRSAVVDEIAHAELDSLVRIKERWRLSIGACVFRLFNLGLIAESTKEHLQRQLGARGWRTWEPLDDELPAERPHVLQRAYQLLCDEGGWTSADITRAMPLNDYDHEMLAGLPSRWMAGQHRDYGELVKLKPSTEPSSGAPRAGGKVLRFPR